MTRTLLSLWLPLVAAVAVLAQSGTGADSNVVTLESTSPLYEIKIMVRAGSAHDPDGKEGTSSLVANALLEASFGDAAKPVTKERVAEITRPWGSRATPTVLAEKMTTTFSMVVPRESFGQFVTQILRPMFNQPLWNAQEVERLKRETLVGIRSRLRLENQEELGLQALDSFIFANTRLQHLTAGTVKGLEMIGVPDLQTFFRQHYTRSNVFVASSIGTAADRKLLLDALPADAVGPAAAQPIDLKAARPSGRELLVITQPNAIASGIHAGFPIDVNRAHPDYWPLYIGNVFLGTHRDSFGRLYTYIREERGYNYGNYSYVEHLVGRPAFLFPPPTTPRTQQYFSIWIRPVGHQYVHFLAKALMSELERLVREGLTAEEVAEAKIKTRTLYLNFAESKDRQLGYRLDDLFYGMRDRGYLETMLRNVDAVTAEQVNAAIKRHLQTTNVKLVIVTNADNAKQLGADIASDSNVVSKTQAEYNIADPVPPDKQRMLERDEQWKSYPLAISADRITIVPVESMFETNPILASGDASRR